MSMPLVIEWKLLTHGKEKRVPDHENQFEIQFNQYKLLPINQEIEIKRHHDSDQIGKGKVIELTWKDEHTYCRYKLTSLHNVN